MTCFGINNEGQLVLDYYHEDTDQLEGANVYNGQKSVLWCNFRDAFPDKIKETYQDLRSNGVLNYDEMREQFITKGSDKWSESIYNEDADFKYISMLYSDNDASNLGQVRGTGEEHLEYFLENRFNYCDGKWYAPDYADDYVALRIYTPVDENGAPRTDLAVAANADITVTPYSYMYAGLRYKANGTLQQKRVSANEVTTFEAPNETFNDTETAIYGASQLSSLGDLSPLYCGSINVSKATKLTELIIGNDTEGYSNPNLNDLSVGTNNLLKVVNVRNCPKLTDPLALAGCPNIEEIYAAGSAITGIDLANSGYLKVIELPATIANLTLKNQLYVESLTLEGYEAIKTINIENCPTVRSLDILGAATNVERVRLTNVNWTYDTAAEVLALADRNLAGIDENGANIDKMWIDGKCHIKTLTGADYLKVKEAFPYLTITYDTLTAQLIFMSEDGNTELTRQTIQNGGDGTDPIDAGTIERPTKESTAQYHFTYSGWSLTPGGVANVNALKKVEADRIVYVSFAKELRSYTVKFYNGTTLLQTSTVQYGGDAVYSGSTPVNNSTGNPDDFEFYGWKPVPTNIQGATDCYAQFYDLREITDDWSTIAQACLDGTATEKYAIGAFKMLDIGEVSLPYEFNHGSAVLYNGEIHILSSVVSEYRTSHYKWDGTKWVEVSTLPYEFYYGSAVVFNGEIHILGGSGSSSGKKKHYKWNGSEWVSVSTLPYMFRNGVAVVYNNEIHIMGSEESSYYTSHYKWNGSSWSEVGELPYSFYTASGFIYNNEIHVLGSYDSKYNTAHYKYDGSSWISVSTLPQKLSNGHALVVGTDIYMIQWEEVYKYDGTSWSTAPNVPVSVYEGDSVVLDGAIYVMGSSISENEKAFYSYSPETGTWGKLGLTESIPMEVIAHNHDELAADQTWKALSPLPYNFYTGSAVILNNEIHILGGQGDHDAHYKWNGTDWVSVSTLPYRFYRSVAVVYNDEIHILGTDYSRTTYGVYHYKWTGTEWVSVSTLPYIFYYGGVVVYNDEIHIMGSGESAHNTKHYKWTGTEWVSVSTLPYACYESSVIVYNNEIHLLGGTYSSDERTNHYKWNGTEWTSVSTLPFQFWEGAAVIFNNEIHIIGGYGDETAHYKWNGTEWTSVSTLPFEFYYGCGVVYNNKITLLGSQVTAYGTTFTQLTGASWKSLGNPTKTHRGASVCVYKDAMHLLGGGGNTTGHYKYNGSTWSSVSTFPVGLGEYDGFNSFIHNGMLYLAKYTQNATNNGIYLFDDSTSTWSKTIDLPIDMLSAYTNSNYVESYNGEIHFIYVPDRPVNYSVVNHYKWNETDGWVEVGIFATYELAYLVTYNDKLIGFTNGRMFEYNDSTTSWSEISNQGVANFNSSNIDNRCVVHEGFLLVFNKGTNKCYKYDGTTWTVFCSTDLSFNEIESFRGRLYGFINWGAMYRYENPRATLTFLAGNALSEDAVVSNTGWENFPVRSTLNNTFLSKLNTDLQDAIKDVNKISDGGYNNQVLVCTSDKIWLPSYEELGATGRDSHVVLGQGETYSVFTDNASRVRKNANGNPVNYFTRTTQLGDKNRVVAISNSGSGSYGGVGWANYKTVFGFCI